jgi:hypothetical protein
MKNTQSALFPVYMMLLVSIISGCANPAGSFKYSPNNLVKSIHEKNLNSEEKPAKTGMIKKAGIYVRSGKVEQVDEPKQAVAQPPTNASVGGGRMGTKTKSSSGTSFSRKTLSLNYQKSKLHKDDVAVIIGNADYSKGSDIPNVIPAYADAEEVRDYVTRSLGVSSENIIFIEDATFADLVSTFGSVENHKGLLYRFLNKNKSRVFVYYSGHGAPGIDGSSYLIPSNAKASLIDLNGYSLSTFYKNLSMLPAASVTVVLEACFSGSSGNGSVIPAASGIYIKPKSNVVPKNITVISAGTADQVASWESDKSHGLFTKYFLKGMSGEADTDNDKNISWDELEKYLAKTVTRAALRNYGREQTPQIINNTH